jgi:hypothetical protein
MRPIVVGFRLSEIEKRLLDKAAKRMGCPVSDVIRWTLRRELAETPKTHLSAGRLDQKDQ